MVDIAPILGESGTGVTASSASQAPPLVGQEGAGAKGTPLEVAEQPAREAIPLPSSGQTELPLALMAPIATGMMPPVEAPPMQAEVVVAVMGKT